MLGDENLPDRVRRRAPVSTRPRSGGPASALGAMTGTTRTCRERIFCRDCLADAVAAAMRCAACGSPRLVRHDELAALAIAHVDCDAFYATIEKRDDPSLAAEPVIVGGGTPRRRRRRLLRRAHLRGAARRCRCSRRCGCARTPASCGRIWRNMSSVGREVRRMMLALTPLVEPLSIDEAFLDLSGTERLHGLTPAKVLARFALDVEKKLAITVSIGLSVQQIPRQDRFRSRQAARICRAGRRRGAGISSPPSRSVSSSASARSAPRGLRATAFATSPTCKRRARSS